jgi:hypothetical protein
MKQISEVEEKLFTSFLYICICRVTKWGVQPQGAGRNNLNGKITPLLPIGIGERYSPTISNLGHAALLRRCESAELAQGAL